MPWRESVKSPMCQMLIALKRANIEKAAHHDGVDLSETNWHQLGVHPQQNREEAARKAVGTKKRRSEL